jgi:hypothetical protein
MGHGLGEAGPAAEVGAAEALNWVTSAWARGASPVPAVTCTASIPRAVHTNEKIACFVFQYFIDCLLENLEFWQTAVTMLNFVLPTTPQIHWPVLTCYIDRGGGVGGQTNFLPAAH